MSSVRYNDSTKSKTPYCHLILFSVPYFQSIWQQTHHYLPQLHQFFSKSNFHLSEVHHQVHYLYLHYFSSSHDYHHKYQQHHGNKHDFFSFLGIWSNASSSTILGITDSSVKVGTIGISRLSLSQFLSS